MSRSANTISHRSRAYGLRAQQLIDGYERQHPGRVAAQLATRAADTRPMRAVVGTTPATNGIPQVILRAFAPQPAVAR